MINFQNFFGGDCCLFRFALNFTLDLPKVLYNFLYLFLFLVLL